MSDIPMPELLSRSAESAGEATTLSAATPEDVAIALGALQAQLAATADYAATLWNALDQVADQLRAGVPAGTSEAAVTWAQSYARALSALAGPAGDSGYGEHEAARLIRDRNQGAR